MWLCPKCGLEHDTSATCCGKCMRLVPRRLCTMATMPLAHVNRHGEPCKVYRWSKVRMDECRQAQARMFDLMELD